MLCHSHFISNFIFEAGQIKHLEAYEMAASIGAMEFALINICLYCKTAIYGCGESMELLSQNIQLYAKRAFHCNQCNSWKCLVILHQLTLDLMGVDRKSFSLFSGGTT